MSETIYLLVREYIEHDKYSCEILGAFETLEEAKTNALNTSFPKSVFEDAGYIICYKVPLNVIVHRSALTKIFIKHPDGGLEWTNNYGS